MNDKVTIDLDEPTRMEILKVWHNLSRIAESIKGRVSSSGNGVHIYAEHVDGVSDELAERHRRIHGDDKYRIFLDIDRSYRTPQTLFDYKENRKSGEWVEHIDSLVSEYDRNRGLKTP